MTITYSPSELLTHQNYFNFSFQIKKSRKTEDELDRLKLQEIIFSSLLCVHVLLLLKLIQIILSCRKYMVIHIFYLSGMKMFGSK